METTLIIVLFVLYLLPTVVAGLRNHHNANAIFVVNMFLGWTLIGWVIALAWSATVTSPPDRSRTALKRSDPMADDQRIDDLQRQLDELKGRRNRREG